MRDLLSAAEMATLSALRLEQRVTVTGPDDLGSTDRVGQQGITAFNAPGGDWLIDFGESGWMWYATRNLRGVEQ